MNGKEQLITYAPLKSAGLGIYLFTSFDTILQVTSSIKNITIIIIGVAIWIANSITKPIRNIVAQIRTVAEGYLTSDDLNGGTKDEIGQLAEKA